MLGRDASAQVDSSSRPGCHWWMYLGESKLVRLTKAKRRVRKKEKNADDLGPLFSPISTNLFAGQIDIARYRDAEKQTRTTYTPQ